MRSAQRGLAHAWRTLGWACALMPLVPLVPALAAGAPVSTPVITEHVRAELLAHAPQGVGAGKPVWLGLLIEHQPHWHTYWKNPGDSGLATTLSWQLPAGVQAGDIAWPTPTPIAVGPLMNYGYEGRLLLPVPVTLPANFSGTALDVALRADWLVCQEICVPESGEFTLRLPATGPIDGQAALFEQALSKVPQTLPAVRAVATLGSGGAAPSLSIEVDGLPNLPTASAGPPQLRLFTETPGVVDYATPITQRWEGTRWLAQVPLSPTRSASPRELWAVLEAPGARAGVQVKLPVQGRWPGEAADAAASATRPAAPTTQPAEALGPALALALLGGALLNLMPCVFPVLSLKLLGFAKPGQRRRTLVASGLAYSAGVIASFVALAGLLLALRAGGELLGWGFQLQSPGFVALLAAVFTLIGLSLAGVFEVGQMLPSGVATLRARHPVADHALTGVLAVAVASPCTAPFMGAALGAALTLPTAQGLLIFAALGLGMALPYLAVSAWPGLAQRLPRPGVWMQHFKVLMAFPMFATVVWLLWVLGQQVGIDGVAGLLGVLLALAFAAWAWGSPGFGRRARLGFGAVSLAALGVSAHWAWPSLQMTNPAQPTTASAATATPEGWQAWSPQAVAEALQQGQPVFVDFTAAWCVTCQVNKRTTLADSAVQAEFAQRGVRLMRADWTRRDPAITEALSGLGRSGVPVYALYAPGGGAPVLLPELLRARHVTDALQALPPASTPSSAAANLSAPGLSKQAGAGPTLPSSPSTLITRQE